VQKLELDDIQGLVLYGYGHLKHAAYLFVEMGPRSAPREWLRALLSAKRIADAAHRPERAVNVAFTASGLERLGLGEDALETFALEFLDGMDHADRARALGDIGPSAPSGWSFGNAGKPRLDALLCLFAKDADALLRLVAETRTEFERHGLSLATPGPLLATPLSPREHFGFVDGLSQPAIEGFSKASSPQVPLKAGEFVLDYEDEYGTRAIAPSVAADDDPENRLAARGERHLFGRNGSYLVFRQLEQHVARFWAYVKAEAAARGEEAEWLAAKMVGRWRNGDSLAEGVPRSRKAEKPTNDFLYAEKDNKGHGCPLGAHVRRANPRDALPPDPRRSLLTVARHRILRRGRSYGPAEPPSEAQPDGKPRGLFFVCINADIRRQFEFIQQTWLNLPSFVGLENEEDAIVGPRRVRRDGDGGSLRADEFTIPAKPYRHCVSGLPHFVETRGGGYFFMPGLQALHYLANVGGPAPVLDEESEDGFGLDVLGDLWRSILVEGDVIGETFEDMAEGIIRKIQQWSSDPDQLRPLFSTLRRFHPILVAPKIAVVTRYDDVKEVLTNASGNFRVTEVYAEPMARTTGPFFLGMEDGERYRHEAGAARRALREGDGERVRAIVRRTAKQLLDAAAAKGRIDLVGGYTRIVAARVVAEHFGVPGPDAATLMRWMRGLFWEIFLDPLGLPDVREGAAEAAVALREHLADLIAARRRNPADDYLSRLVATDLDDDGVARVVGGIIVGAVDTTSKAASQVVAWLLAHPHALDETRRAIVAGDEARVSRCVFEALRFAPQAPLLLRHCAADTVVAAGTDREKVIPAGHRVIVAKLSASFDEWAVPDPDAFRSDREDPELFHFGWGQHQCFGRLLNRVQIPELVSLLLRRDPRLVEGSEGEMTFEGPFPDKMILEL
jgi:Dyp-type peroxidase family